MANLEVRRMVPDTRKTMVGYAALALNAYLKLPGEFTSLKLVTSNTVVSTDEVPRPPVVYAPIPSAPGKAIAAHVKMINVLEKIKNRLQLQQF